MMGRTARRLTGDERETLLSVRGIQWEVGSICGWLYGDSSEYGVMNVNITKWIRYLSAIFSVTGTSILFLLMFYVTIDVASRYLFNQPLPGTIEVSEVVMTYIIFLPMAWIQSKGGHIRMTLFSDRLSDRGKIGMEILVSLASILVLGMITWFTGVRALESVMSGEYRQSIIYVPVFPGRIAIALGSGLYFLHLLFEFPGYISQFLRREGNA